MRRRTYAGDDFGADVVASLTMALLLLLIYLAIKAINLIVRAMRKQPENKALWADVICVAVSSLLALLTRGNDMAVLLFCVSSATLLLTAYIVDVSSDDLFQKPPETLVSSVLHHSWWDMGDRLAA